VFLSKEEKVRSDVYQLVTDSVEAELEQPCSTKQQAA
jgi:hypothetical protein